jgi:DNA-directed RNA polymerase subunit beta
MRIFIPLFTSRNMKFCRISQGSVKKITKEIPHLEEHLLHILDKIGVVRLGSQVETGDILVGKLTPQIASESSYITEARLL